MHALKAYLCKISMDILSVT